MKSNSLKRAPRYFLYSFPVIAAVLFLVCAGLSGQAAEKGALPEEDFDSCTSIQVGRLASEDGSVITCHTCDGNYRQWVNIIPGAKHLPTALTRLYSGKMHTAAPYDMANVRQTGEIPDVPVTFAFLNTAYPCLNEKGLAIGETTIMGREELYNPEGQLMIEEIERLVLERCSSARAAIKLAGELVKACGYGDYGECITIADAREVWQFEIFGAGPLEKGGVWAAERIPDDHIGISANIPRIGELDLKDPDHFMASENVFKVAQEMGFWDSKSGKAFKFWEAYSGRKPFSSREYFVFNSLAPSMKLDLNATEIPFSVRPDKKVSVRDVLRLYRETYSGTGMDMTRNLMVPKGRNNPELVKSRIANPWMSRDLVTLLNTIKPGTVDQVRTIAISACSYATVIQIRGWLPPSVGAVCWFAFDNPAQSARIPIFAGVTELPPAFEICAQHGFRLDSAAWAFRRANRLATVRWGDTKKIVEDTVREFEDKAFAELPFVEKEVLRIEASKAPDKEPFTVEAYLTKYSNDFARAAVQKYLELGDKFWEMFAMGF